MRRFHYRAFFTSTRSLLYNVRDLDYESSYGLLPGAGGRKRRSTLSARQRQHVESTALSNELAV